MVASFKFAVAEKCVRGFGAKDAGEGEGEDSIYWQI